MRATAALTEAAGKSILILAAAFLLATIMRRNAAATRHFIWFAALASLPALPLATALAPRWNNPAWANALFHPTAGLFSGNSAPAAVTGEAAPIRPRDLTGGETRPPSRPVPSSSTATPLMWRSLVWPAWSAGVAFSLLFFIGQRWKLRRIERTARPVTNPELLESMDLMAANLGCAKACACWKRINRSCR